MKDFFVISAYTSKMNATGWLAMAGVGFGAIISFMFSTKLVALVFAIMLILDFITGIIAASTRDEKITSKRIREMWYKEKSWHTYIQTVKGN